MPSTLACLVIALSASGCVVWRSDYERDLAALKTDLEQQKKEAGESREQLKADQAKAIKEVNDAMDALNRVARKSGADLAVELEKSQADLASLKGQLEVINHKLDQEGPGMVERDRKLAVAYDWVEKRQKQMDAAEHPTDKAAVYQLALKKLEAGDTRRARELLTEFLAKFKTDPYAANAQYWLGETYYAEKSFNDAIVEFQKVLKDWKTSEKTADALLKIGMSFQAQGDCANAVLFFDEVVANHRGSGAAKVAKDKLGECKKKRAGK